MKRTGPPLRYLQLGLTHFGVYMAPDTKGIVLELDCVMVPKPYTEDVSPIKLRKNFQQAAVYLTVSEFYASRGDAKRGQEYLQRYLETAGLMQLKPWYPERQYRYGGYEAQPKAELPG